MLQKLKITTYTKNVETILSSFFWDSYFSELCELIERHSALALRSSYKLRTIIKPDYFTHLVTTLEKHVAHARYDYQTTKDLITHYER